MRPLVRRVPLTERETGTVPVADASSPSRERERPAGYRRIPLATSPAPKEAGLIRAPDNRLPGRGRTTDGHRGFFTARDETITDEHARMPEPGQDHRDRVAAF